MAMILLDAVEGGGYVSIAKVVPVLLVPLLWTKMLAWADKDAVAAHLPAYQEQIEAGLRR